ncbi:DUF5673 domain-containing protein [Wukongibacter baidiensis]|uniref:DUF5673 domain-containing protein n=1 Tax=Wukongibacter baidiensis TaxID=1723361 RepID=UPI003D7F9138
MIIVLSLFFIVSSFLLIHLLRLIDIRNTYGRFIIKLRKRNGLLVLSVLFLFVFIYLLVLKSRPDKYRDFSDLLTPLLWILISLVHILRAIKYSNIREKGIYLDRGFYDWSKIYSYEWISSDTIKFKAKGLMLSDFQEKVKVVHANRENVDAILRRYVNPSSPTSS